MRSIVNLIFLFVFAQFQHNGIAQPANSAWPMLQHDPQHTGRSSYTGPENPKVKWVYESGVSINSSPVLAPDGTIYFCESERIGLIDSSGYLYALNPDGALKWEFDLGAPAANTCPAIASDGTIYVHRAPQENLYGTSAVIAINPDGTLKWKYEDQEFYGDWLASPVIGADGTVYVSFEEVCLYAFTPSGDVKWVFVSPTVSSISSSPALSEDGIIYVTDASFYLYAIDSFGNLKWHYNLYPGAGGAAGGSPCVGGDGTIYVTDYDSSLAAINSDGTLKWKCALGPYGYGNNYNTPVIGNDGTIYFGGGGSLHAINMDGTIKWTYPTTSFYLVVDANETIYTRGTNFIQAIDANGLQKWILSDIHGSYPSFAIGDDGTLYFSSAKHWYFDLGINGLFAVEDSTATSVELRDNLPNEFSVSQNYPNPFNPTTTIKYAIPKSSRVKLLVYNSLGEEMKELINEFKSPGEYEVKFEAENLPSGVYFYIITSGNNTITRKMLLLK